MTKQQHNMPKRLKALPWDAASWEMDDGESAFRIKFAKAGDIAENWKVARLIDAAPRMYAVLEQLERDLSKIKGASGVLRPIRAALAKAKGDAQ